MNIKSKIASLRSKIDQVDKNILKLLKQRMAIVIKIGKLKRLNKIAVVDKKREKDVLKRTKTGFERSIFEKIVSESKKLQKRAKK